MSNGLISLREKIHNRTLKLRSILNIICKPSFSVLWDNSDDKIKEKAKKYIDKFDKGKLLNWIDNHPSLGPAEMNYNQLKKTAIKLNIPNYSRLNKLELIQECERKMNEKS